MVTRVLSIAKDERGQGLVEYALIIALVAMAAVIAMRFFGSQTNGMMTNTSNTIGNVES